MQNLERFLGFRVRASQYLPGVRLADMGADMARVARANGLRIEEYSVYVHNLSIIPGRTRFLKGNEWTDRLNSLVIAFTVNEKQRKSGKLFFANHFFDGSLEPVHQYADYHWIQYTLFAHELTRPNTLSHQLITFVHQSLPLRHRKIKLSVMARPSEILPEGLRNPVLTRVDLRYERYTAFQLLKRADRANHGGGRKRVPSASSARPLTKLVFNDSQLILQTEGAAMSKYEFNGAITSSAIGDNAQYLQNANTLSTKQLIEALELAIPALADRAKTPSEIEAVQAASEAKTAAESGATVLALERLNSIGKWGWDVLKDLSASIASEALLQLMGLKN